MPAEKLPASRRKRTADDLALQQEYLTLQSRVLAPAQPDVQISMFAPTAVSQATEAAYTVESPAFDISGISPATFIPGYEWWQPALYQDPVIPLSSTSNVSSVPPTQTTIPSQEFTFNQLHFSPTFVESIRDPILHFPSAFSGY